MEKNNVERVMAYEFAQEIKNDEMDDISGGAGSLGTTTGGTHSKVMLNGQSTLSVDYTRDF